MSVTLRFDKMFAVEEWIALYKAAEYNQRWSERNAGAALAHAYLVTTAWMDGYAVGRTPGSGDPPSQESGGD